MKTPKPSRLTARQRIFVAEYLVDRNATRAAICAGLSAKTATSAASRMLTNVNVRREIDAAVGARTERLEVKADDVLRELMRIASTDLRTAFDDNGRMLPVHKLPDDIARAIAGIEVDQMGDGIEGTTAKIKLWDKVKALELLAKHLKLLTDKHEVTGADGEPFALVIDLGGG